MRCIRPDDHPGGHRFIDGLPEAAPPRATTPEPDCCKHGQFPSACGCFVRASSPSRESGALLDAAQQEIARFWKIIDRIAEIIGAEESDLDIETAVQMYVDWATGNLAASDARLSTLERDAARMREAAKRLFDAFDRHTAAGKTITRDIAGALVEFRAALTPSGEPTTTPETSE